MANYQCNLVLLVMVSISLFLSMLVMFRKSDKQNEEERVVVKDINAQKANKRGRRS